MIRIAIVTGFICGIGFWGLHVVCVCIMHFVGHVHVRMCVPFRYIVSTNTFCTFVCCFVSVSVSVFAYVFSICDCHGRVPFFVWRLVGRTQLNRDLFVNLCGG